MLSIQTIRPGTSRKPAIRLNEHIALKSPVENIEAFVRHGDFSPVWRQPRFSVSIRGLKKVR